MADEKVSTYDPEKGIDHDDTGIKQGSDRKRASQLLLSPPTFSTSASPPPNEVSNLDMRR
jgi:hypothetical protein